MNKKRITKLSTIMAFMMLFSASTVQAYTRKTRTTTTTPVTTTTTVPVVSTTNQIIVKATDNLQNALSSGKSLLIESGTYSITKVTQISSNIIIEGQINTIINGNNTGSFSVSGLHDVEFKNIIFTNLSEMDFTNSTNLKFTNCKFNNFVDNGIVLNTFNNVEFSGCVISKIGSTGINPTWQGMGMYLVDGTNLKIHDSEISNSYGHGALFLTNNTSFEIRNNQFHDTFYRAIELYENGNAGTIHDNNIYNAGSINTTNSGIGCNGIFANGDSSGVNIISNTISNVLENAIEGQFGSILTNTITGTGIDMINHPTPSGEGIYLTSGKCDSNIIKNTNGPGIKGYSDDTIANVEINGNTLTNCIGSDYAIALNSQIGYTNLTIMNNTAYSTLKCVGLRDKPLVNVIVSGNTVK